jgi:type II restriction/modification system DNA methylase subunit YeeA
MNKAKLKSYAPQARKDFIAAVTARAHRLGLSESNGQLQIAPAEKSGDLVIIAGQSWSAKISRQRDNLIALIQKHGFAQTMENVAYTWFNRFAALRYMEIHDYLTHGYRVLSNRAGGLPEILGAAPELAQNGDLPGLNPQRAIELKLTGDQDGELYRLTLIAQCNALSNAMPFLFERIDDETELLLPDNLLLTDSVVAKLVKAIQEEDWSQVEIIGWLYQFYISEKKDQVIGKVVKSEDIPAATQLFTPNWIVQYLVQNSIGRLWLMANPASALKSQWPYYIEPSEQTPEVQAQLDVLIQARMAEDGGSLNPETITVLDPACGSGHILVEAYEVLKAIYLERGYQPRSIPRLILEKNLFGLDIDDRAAQLAGFALLMKARADDRRLLDNPPKLNVLALQESKGLDADELFQHLNIVRIESVKAPLIHQLLDTFAHSKTLGSLIQIPLDLNVQLVEIYEGLQLAIYSGDIPAQEAALNLLPLVRQAQILAMQFDAVAANPPYMGGKGMFPKIKTYLKMKYPDSKTDIYAAFIERGLVSAKSLGCVSMVTMQSWMFLSSYEALRSRLIREKTLVNLAHFGPKAFSEISGEVVQTVAFSFINHPTTGFKPVFHRLIDGGEDEKNVALLSNNNRFDQTTQEELSTIDGSIVAYWCSKNTLHHFGETKLNEIAIARRGLQTGDGPRFIREWFEVSSNDTLFSEVGRSESIVSTKSWFLFNNGGEYRKWAGSVDYVVNWKDNGKAIKTSGKAIIPSEHRYFDAMLTWSRLSSGKTGFRFVRQGVIPGDTGPAIFVNDLQQQFLLLSFLNSKVAEHYLRIIVPTLTFLSGDIERIPCGPLETVSIEIGAVGQKCFQIAQKDWDSFEISWGFRSFPWVAPPHYSTKICSSWTAWENHTASQIIQVKAFEEEINRLFIEAYGLQDEISPEVPEEQITLARADRQKDCQRLISYAIGCMMGRYSLDEPGLIYAHAGNAGFDPTRYRTFPADADGIVPITDELWFEDDAANRIREFLLAVWGAETLDENLAWLAESLGQKANETPQETIRRYLAGSFFKDHLQTYKKRPIYWLFSSGKQGAFQALVYLHRYHEGTLARMRAEYVVPLTGKIQSRIEMLEKDAAAAPSNAARNKLSKDIEKLKKKHVELLAYDEKLRHYADLRIQLDLDDGVKVNYGRVGDLLAEVKAVTGGASDD